MIEITNILDSEKYVKSFRAIIFDLDDTLYSETDYVRSGYRQIAKVCPEIPDMYAKLWSVFGHEKNPIDAILKSEHLYSEEKLRECLSAYREQAPDIHLYDGVADMLLRLRSKGHRLGIITDGRPEGQHAKIEALGLKEYFDKIIITDELGGIGFRKPNPRAFEEMRQALHIEYSEMVYIGDNIHKDFIAPKKLGMETILFKNKNGLYKR